MTDDTPNMDVDEEVHFQKALDAMDSKAYHSADVTQKYLNELGAYDTLTPEEEYRVACLVKQGDKGATETMITANLRLVVKIARPYIKPNVSFIDLIEEGNLGLIHAVEKFEPEKGFRFSTYATWWIKHYIERFIMNQARSVRIPVHITKEMNSYLHAAHRLTQMLNREPTHEEIAEMVDQPLEKIQQILQYNVHATSLDAPVEKAPNKTLSDVLANDAPDNPEGSMMLSGVGEQLGVYLDQLPDLERTVLNHRFGLGDHEAMSLIEVGEVVGLTRERVRQIQSRALATLAKHMRADGFDYDIESLAFDE